MLVFSSVAYPAYPQGPPSANSIAPRPDPRRKTEEYMTTFMKARTLPVGELLAAGGALIKVFSVQP